MKDLKEKGMFLAEVAIAMIVIGLFQEKVMQIPVFGGYLPGAKS